MLYFYKRFREIRQQNSLSQEEIACKLGIKQTQYSRYERGAQEFPLRLAVRFSLLMNCSLDYLLELSNEKQITNPNQYPEYLTEEDKRNAAPKDDFQKWLEYHKNRLEEEYDQIERQHIRNGAKAVFEQFPPEMQKELLKQNPNFIKDFTEEFINDADDEKKED